MTAREALRSALARVPDRGLGARHVHDFGRHRRDAARVAGFTRRMAIPDPMRRNVVGGVAMGLTAIALIHSPWGKRSGAHMNPAVTLTFLRLGKTPAGTLSSSSSLRLLAARPECSSWSPCLAMRLPIHPLATQRRCPDAGGPWSPSSPSC